VGDHSLDLFTLIVFFDEREDRFSWLDQDDQAGEGAETIDELVTMTAIFVSILLQTVAAAKGAKSHWGGFTRQIDADAVSLYDGLDTASRNPRPDRLVVTRLETCALGNGRWTIRGIILGGHEILLLFVPEPVKWELGRISTCYTA
jgi:hypothetical protein